jgi:hypothetical protein
MRAAARPADGTSICWQDSDVFPNLLRQMFNLPMQLVSGYQCAAETVLAIQRGEVDGRCG